MKLILEKISNGKMKFIPIKNDGNSDTPKFERLFDSFDFSEKKGLLHSSISMDGIGSMSGGRRYWAMEIFYGKNDRGEMGFKVIPTIPSRSSISGGANSLEEAREKARVESMKLLEDIFIWNKKDLDDNAALFRRFEKKPEEVRIKTRAS